MDDHQKARQDDVLARADLNKAAQLFQQARALWEQFQQQFERYQRLQQQASAALADAERIRSRAAAKRNDAVAMSKSSRGLHAAEELRARAIVKRAQAQRLTSRAVDEDHRATAAEADVQDGKTALAQLAASPQFAEAVQTIQADIARELAVAQAARLSARADRQASSTLLSQATQFDEMAKRLEGSVATPAQDPRRNRSV